MSNKNHSATVGALMLVAGGIIGAGLALLYAPQSGKATRKELAKYAKRTRRRAEGVVDEFADNISEMVDAVGDRASEILEKGKDLAHDAKKDLLKAIEEGQDQLEKQKKKLAKIIG